MNAATSIQASITECFIPSPAVVFPRDTATCCCPLELTSISQTIQVFFWDDFRTSSTEGSRYILGALSFRKQDQQSEFGRPLDVEQSDI